MILDTNAVSDLLAGNPALERVLTGSERHHLPVVVLGEYHYGIVRSRHRKSLGALLDRLQHESHILYPDCDTARVYAVVRDELRSAGTPIPENDVWISALARQHRLAIASLDRHFDCVKDIRRVSW